LTAAAERGGQHRRFIEDIRLYEIGKAFGKTYVDGHFEGPAWR
jgi:hypothetical protein